MSSVPRILRASPSPDVRRWQPTPVIARLWWRHLKLARDVQAWALATAGPATLIRWQPLDLAPREDWIPTGDIRFPGEDWDGPDRPLPFDPPYALDEVIWRGPRSLR